MSKVWDFIYRNGVKLIMTVIITWGLFFAITYVQSMKADIANLTTSIVSNQISQKVQYTNTLKGLLVIIQQLEEIAQANNFIIDQNRLKLEHEYLKTLDVPPSYDELKAQTVVIMGCSEVKPENKETSSLPIDENTDCWIGTGGVIKITDTETYILTNNHVAGKGIENVSLFVENEDEKVKAEVVKYHIYVDMAVIKVPVVLKNKKAIKGITKANISDEIYLVGHPLGVKNVYSYGVVAGYEGVSLLLQIPCIYGNSGSIVINKNGYVVGLVFALEAYEGVFGLPKARITHALAVDSVSIKSFLKELGLYNE